MTRPTSRLSGRKLVVAIPGRTIHYVELAVGTVVERFRSRPTVVICAVECEHDPLSVAIRPQGCDHRMGDVPWVRSVQCPYKIHVQIVNAVGGRRYAFVRVLQRIVAATAEHVPLPSY